MTSSVFEAPEQSEVEMRVLNLIDELRDQMRFRVGEPRRWFGSLRRMTFARAVQASNSIEGYDATLDDVVAAVDHEDPLDASTETRLALDGYRDAMTYVLLVAHDDEARIDEGLLKSLHFMMLKHELKKNPGRWRPGPIFVRREATGEVVYEGPRPDLVPGLIGGLLHEMERDVPPLIRAAICHLNFVMIHPHSDGNGRMARCLQTLVLAREQIVAPVFSSIEEYLGRNTQAYYDVLGDVGRGAWNPHHDPRPWIRFCLTAHYRQAQTHLRRIQEAEDLYGGCLKVATSNGLPERTVAGLYDAAHGLRIRNSSYRKLLADTMSEDITLLTASRDLRAMVSSGLLVPQGEGRGRFYVGDSRLLNIRGAIRATRPARDDQDPFEIASTQLELPL